MTNEELIKELRDSKGWPNLGNAAADRIEELLAAHESMCSLWAAEKQATGILDDPSWVDKVVYLGKPAPSVHHTYVNVYKNGHTGLPYSTLSAAKSHCGGSVVKTIRVDTIGDEVSVTVLD